MRQALGQARKSVKRLRSGLRKTNGVRQTAISQASPQWRVLGWAGRSAHGSEPRSAGPMARQRNGYSWAGHQCSFDTVGREWMLRAKQNQILGPGKKVGMKALGEFGWGPVRCIYTLKALTDFSSCPQTKTKINTTSIVFHIYNFATHIKIISLKSLLPLQRIFQSGTHLA